VHRLLPPGVEPDLHEGSAWVSVVAFVMLGTRLCAGPKRPTLPPIPELNVRTYVRVDDVPGIWFLTLDTSSRPFIAVGRALYGLAYRRSHMRVADEDSLISYVSAAPDASFSAAYRPAGPASLAAPGSLDHFLAERYRLFARRRGHLVTAEVVHEPWLLQPAEARIPVNRMAPPGLSFEGEPLVRFACGVDALIGRPEPVRHRSG
jgi:uncharacterized protein